MWKKHNIVTGVIMLWAALWVGEKANAQVVENNQTPNNIENVQTWVKKQIADIDTIRHEDIINMQFSDIIDMYWEDDWTMIIRNHLTIEINKIREQYNVPELRQDKYLNDAAQLHAAYMHKHWELTHNEKGLYIRLACVWYVWTFVCENVSYMGSGNITIDNVVKWRKNSKPHFSNIISKESLYLGFGAYWQYMVLDFGK